VSSLQFPDIDAAQHWYSTTLDGIRGLRGAINNQKAPYISDDTLDELFGMSPHEWQSFLEDKIDTHETFSTLALMAACEGGIRRDFEWRSRVNSGQEHFVKFNTLYLSNPTGHLGLWQILDTWRAATNHTGYFKNHLNNLSNLFVARNQLAHGRASLKSYVFSPTYQELNKVRLKWRDTVSDFRGF